MEKSSIFKSEDRKRTTVTRCACCHWWFRSTRLHMKGTYCDIHSLLVKRGCFWYRCIIDLLGEYWVSIILIIDCYVHRGRCRQWRVAFVFHLHYALITFFSFWIGRFPNWDLSRGTIYFKRNWRRTTNQGVSLFII